MSAKRSLTSSTVAIFFLQTLHLDQFDVIWSICSFGKGTFILIFDKSVFLSETPQRFDNNIIILTH